MRVICYTDCAAGGGGGGLVYETNVCCACRPVHWCMMLDMVASPIMLIDLANLWMPSCALCRWIRPGVIKSMCVAMNNQIVLGRLAAFCRRFAQHQSDESWGSKQSLRLAAVWYGAGLMPHEGRGLQYWRVVMPRCLTAGKPGHCTIKLLLAALESFQV